MSHTSVERNDVLGTSPADHVEKVSRYLETSVGNNTQDKTSHAPADAESDSGDSLFLTQAPAPEAVRLKRRHRGSLRSKPISPRDLEESEDDAASSSSSSTFGGEPEVDERKRRKRSLQLPQFSFPFLTGRFKAQQNGVLHNSTMAGFFKCVRELCPGPHKDVDSFSTLPTVDMDGENISPLSEGEDDWSESEDIKIVERRCFIVSSRTKHPQPWYVPEEGDGPVEQQRIEGTGTPRRGRKRKTAAKASTSRVTASSSDTENCDGQRSRKVLAVNEKKHKHATGVKSSLVQPETPRTKRWLVRANNKALVQEEEKNEKNQSTDSDDTFCETLERQRSPGKSTPTCKEASNVTELHANVFHTDALPQTEEVEDEPESQSLIQSLPGFASDINTDATDSESTGRKKEPSSLTAPQMDDELQLNEDACVEDSSHDDITLIQEKTLLSDSDTVNVTQEEGGNVETEERLEDSVFSMTSESMNSSQEKKNRERSVEEIQTNTVSKLLNNDAETPKKKKKMKKQKEVEAEEGVDLSSSHDVTLKESTGQSGKKMKKKKRKGISEGVDVSCTPDKNENVNNSESSQKTKEDSGEQDEVMTKKKKKKRESISEGVDISCPLDINVDTDCSQKTIEGPGEQDEPLTKKKKKKKKKKRESISEADVLCTADENKNISNVDCSQKIKEVPDKQDEQVTKKKKKKSEIFCTNVSEDTVTQSDELVSVQKKEKRRTSSFLIADAEEKVAQTPEEQSSPRSNSVAADFETESAETAGNLEASNDGVRKKKRKRKESVVQKNDEDQGFGEPNETCQSILSKTTDTDIKKKKKRKKEDAELMTPVEKLDNSADVGYSQTNEAMVLKKKKKKKKKSKDVPDHVTPESPPTATDAEPEGGSEETCSSVSHKKRDEQSKRHSADVSPASCKSEKAIKEKLNKDEQASPSADTPTTPVLNHVRDKKKKKKENQLMMFY